MRFILASGETITVHVNDIDKDATITAGNTPVAPAESTDVPALASVQPSIRAKCAKEWPEDFSVRAFCEKTQIEALAKLRARPMTATPDHQTIRRKCAREWPDDFTVRNFCEETELKALASIK
jgi:hypothetical protein